MHHCKLRLAAVALGMGAFCFAGCSSSDDGDGTDAGPPADTGTMADTGTTDTGVEDTGEPTVDTGRADTGEPPVLARFEYRRKTTGCQRNCTEGIRVNVVSDRITEIQDRNEEEELESSDVQDLEESHLTQEVADKMKNGWECGDSTEHNGATHLFESLPGDAEFDQQPDVQNVAGCIPTDSDKADAELVQSLISKLESLRGKYFN